MKPCVSKRYTGRSCESGDAFMAEWSRRQTQVLVLSEGVGSNPTECSRHLFYLSSLRSVGSRPDVTLRPVTHTRTPPIAQLVERETVAVTQRISLGPWFESGWVDPFFSPPVKDASSLTFTSHPLTHSLTPVPTCVAYIHLS